MVGNTLDNQSEDFFKRLVETIETANKKQTLELKTEIESIKTAINQERIERSQLEEKYKELKQKYTSLEKSLRKNNIIIFGIENNSEKPIAEFIVEKLNSLLNLNITADDINDTFTIGKQQQNKPIIVKFISYLKKQQVLKNSYKLKETNKTLETKIFISEELSLEERAAKKILHKHLREAKSKKLNAYVKGYTLHVNGETYTSQQLAQIDLANNEGETVEEDIQNDQPDTGMENKPNSAPATPNIRRNREEEKESTEEEIATKKRKLAKTLASTRSSSRNQENKQQPRTEEKKPENKKK